MIEPGQVFGAWRVIRQASDGRYLCECTVCNVSQKRVKRHDLETGKSLMCKACSGASLRQAEAYTGAPEYVSWVAMIQRCTNPNNKDYASYGGRGITVCPLWLNSYEAFFLTMGAKPDPSYTIERIDYNKGYEPGNCKWATREEQTKNKSDNVHITIDGETKVVTDWAKDPRCSVSAFTIYKRLKRGWSGERAVLESSQKKVPHGDGD